MESEVRARSDVNSERNANVLGARHEARIPSDASAVGPCCSKMVA